MTNNENSAQPLATEMYEDLKKDNQFKEKVIFWLVGVIVLLIVALAGTNVYHIYQWSQFDTVVVDSADGGNANYVQGDNTGGIYNGESYSTPQKEEDIQGDPR